MGTFSTNVIFDGMSRITYGDSFISLNLNEEAWDPCFTKRLLSGLWGGGGGGEGA